MTDEDHHIRSRVKAGIAHILFLVNLHPCLRVSTHVTAALHSSAVIDISPTS